jgi:hypothetical protein
LSSCTQEVSLGQSSALRSGDKSKISSLAATVASVQARYLVSRGLGSVLYLITMSNKAKKIYFYLFRLLFFLKIIMVS